MINALKIKKLKKLKQNTYYAWCKESYQRLNHIGKKEFQNFQVYAKAFQRQCCLSGNYEFNIHNRGSVNRPAQYSYYLSMKWAGYHTQDFNSTEYYAASMDYGAFRDKYMTSLRCNLYSNNHNYLNSGIGGFATGLIVGAMFF